jgi:uncharacterized membrane protein
LKLSRAEIGSIAVISLSFAASLWFLPRMPEQMATHWGMDGQVNGYMPKMWGLFFVPLLQLVMGIFFWAIPRLDPLKANIAKFQKYYQGFILVLLLFMLALHLHVLLWNSGIKISPNRFLPISLGLLFYYIGIMLQNAKPNWFVGIRTPWTLSNERVWEKTHAIGGKLFKAAAVIALLGVAFPNLAFWFILVPVIAVTLFAYIYSYLEYRKEGKAKA